MLSSVCRRRRRSSSVTLHGGPVEFRPLRATPCLICSVVRFSVFRAAGATRYTDQGLKFGLVEPTGALRSAEPPDFT